MNDTATDHFCNTEKQSCWKILHEEGKEMAGWLLANKVLLSRYQSLTAYPRWQLPITVNRFMMFPDYSDLKRGQSMLQASAMLAIEKGQIKQGLDLIDSDIHFVRKILANDDSFLGKIHSTIMLSKDLALLSETLQVHAKELKPHLAQIEKMLTPLTPLEISNVNALKSNQQYILAEIDNF